MGNSSGRFTHNQRYEFPSIFIHSDPPKLSPAMGLQSHPSPPSAHGSHFPRVPSLRARKLSSTGPLPPRAALPRHPPHLPPRDPNARHVRRRGAVAESLPAIPPLFTGSLLRRYYGISEFYRARSVGHSGRLARGALEKKGTRRNKKALRRARRDAPPFYSRRILPDVAGAAHEVLAGGVCGGAVRLLSARGV